MPPSARTIEPVVKLDASEAKNSAAPTISRGSPARCSDKLAERVVCGLLEIPRLADVGEERAGHQRVDPDRRAERPREPSVIALSPAFDDA